jgi:hypothetical protein
VGDRVRTKAEDNRAPAGFSSFYKTRRRVYGSLLLFIIAAGLPIATIPGLRDRLLSRTWALKDAMAGKRAPAMIQVGQNQEPLPPEFQRPAIPAMPRMPVPPPARVHSTEQGGYVPGSRSPQRGSLPDSRKAMPPGAEESAEEAASESTAADNEPKYGQGTAERQAFDLLIASNATVAEIVKGNNPSFSFKSWDAAGRGDDVIWVRLKLQGAGQPEADYIWQVKLGAKQVSPLNYNARSIQ